MISNRSDLSRRSEAKTATSPRGAWCKADIRRARRTPLKPILERLGYCLLPLSNGNWQLCGITPEILLKDHYWVCPETGQAGNAIDFLVRVKRVSFNEAMRLLTS